MLIIIVAARHNEWNLLKNSQGFPVHNIEEYSIPKITLHSEAERFADCVTQYLELSRIDLFINNAYSFLYAAMLMLVYNKNSLDEIAKSIVEKLLKNESRALKLLAYIVLSEHLNIPFLREQYRETCETLGLTPYLAIEALTHEVLNKKGDVYETRRIVISTIL